MSTSSKAYDQLQPKDAQPGGTETLSTRLVSTHLAQGPVAQVLPEGTEAEEGGPMQLLTLNQVRAGEDRRIHSGSNLKF